jgi:hypothetical protein
MRRPWKRELTRARGACRRAAVPVAVVPALVPARGARHEVEADQVGEAQPRRAHVALEHAEQEIVGTFQAGGPAGGPAVQFIGAPLPAGVGKLVHVRPSRLVRLDQLEVVELAAFLAFKADPDQRLKLRVGELACLGEQREQHGPLPGGQLVVMHVRTTPIGARENRK